jgi:hypothetical protein
MIEGEDNLRRFFTNKFHIAKHHGEYGDWRIDNKYAELHLCKLAHLLTETKLIDHKEIAWKNLPCMSRGIRYDECDISCPGILSLDAPNPHGKKYRMIDGNHRMSKMTNMKVTESCYYIIEYAILKPFFIFHRTP